MSTTKTATTGKARTMRAATTTKVCAIYVRISYDRHRDEHGVENQKPLALTLARKHGYHVPEWAVYVDNDKSATKRHVRRDAYERLLADVQAGKVQAIACTFADRLYRRNEELERLVNIVEAHHVDIHVVHGSDVDLSTAGGRLHARILGSVAQHESEVKAERVKLANTRLREAGKMTATGLRMFGYDRDGSIREDEAKLVRDVARRLLAGEPITGLCHRMNAAGARTSQGNAWQITSLNRLLRNPRLAGYSVYQGQVVGRGQWEPVLDEETWLAVCALLASNGRGRLPRVALLPGLLYCGKCGAAMTTGSRAKTGGRVRTYRCNTDPGAEGCGSSSVVAEPVETIVEDFARERLADPQVRKALGKLRKGGESSVAGDLNRLRARLAELEEAMEDPDEDFKALRVRAKSVRAKVREAEARLVEEVRDRAEVPDLDEAWPTDLLARRRLVELVVRRVTLAPGRGGKFRPERVQIDPVPMV